MGLTVDLIGKSWYPPGTYRAKSERLPTPSREHIREFWEVLRSCSGTIELNVSEQLELPKKQNPGQGIMTEVETGIAKKCYVTIDGIRGEYFMVQVDHRDKEWLIIDESKETVVYDEDTPATTLEIGVGECLEHNTLNDFDHTIKMVEAFLDTGKMVDDAPYVWLALYDHLGRFNF